MEKTDQELMRHVCKLCNKSFPCGRSLGGHMRSHVINSTDHHPPHHHQQKKKLSSLNNNGGKFTNKKMTFVDGSSNSNDSGGYELRKDPKKTLKAKDSSEVENNTTSCLVVLDKLCKECGKGFQSWKALFGHMKCHSDKVSNNHNHHTAANLGQDSWTSQSDNENSNSGAKSSRIKRSRSRSRNKRIKRYIVTSATTATVTTTTTTTTTASSSISMNANANNNQISNINASTSVVSEVEQEQEAEIAMCLMMLSRDVGKWGNSQTESSAFIEANVVRKTKAESFKSRNGSKMKKPAETRVGVDSLGRSEVGFDGLEKSMIISDEFDDQSESGFGKFEDPSKRKFECTTCNKSFHSYQALGGHRASHKKLKGCFDSKIEGENKIENQPMFDHEHTINGFGEKTSENHQATASFNLGGGASKKTLVLGAHECPICLRIFSSGQALGGHKRSHLIAEAKLNQQNSINEIEKVDEPVSETRGFLDLNMPPAPMEEEEEMILSSSIIGGYKPWYWAESTNHHNNEPTLLGLLSTS